MVLENEYQLLSMSATSHSLKCQKFHCSIFANWECHLELQIFLQRTHLIGTGILQNQTRLIML